MLNSKTVEQIRKRLEVMSEWRYASAGEVHLEGSNTMEHYRVPPESLSYAPAPVGSIWGEYWSTVWFRGAIEIEKDLRGKRVFYRNRYGGERLLFLNNAVYSGMDAKHNEVLLLPKARGGEQFRIHLEAYSGHPMWEPDPFRKKIVCMHGIPPVTKAPPPLPLLESSLVYERVDVSAFVYDIEVLFKTALILDENAARRAVILETLRGALDRISLQWKSEEELSVSIGAAKKIIAPLMKSKNAATTPHVGITGHAHIDVGWLWPVRESIRKSARTFSTVLNLMDDYPEASFIQSQAALYEMIEQHYPDLLTRIKKRVKEGRWEPNGAMWVEADCNISGGEALVRQLLEGGKKFLELFGYRGDTLWLPDVFGYSAALPQILKKSGILNFVTSKLNWNDTNRIPYDTFAWRGIDGSEVFTAFITARKNGYNADVDPESMQEAWNYVQQKELQDKVLVSVGWGDGGGGPTREMCERARRMVDLEGCPQTRFTNVSSFLKELREQQVNRPCWVGELYFEYHRGTYTTQARTKRWNRRMEYFLRDVEILCAMAMLEGLEYPAQVITEQWRILLTNQFHDILPGSSIREVYRVAEEQYEQMEKTLGALLETCMNKLSARFQPDAEGHAWALANTLGSKRCEIIELCVEGFNSAVDGEGMPLPTQKTQNGLAVKVVLPPLSVMPIALRSNEEVPPSPFSYTGPSLDTPYYHVEFDKGGRITGLYDKEIDREIVRTGNALNAFYTAEDRPLNWDAWDIDRYYRDTIRQEERLERREVVEDGPLFITIRSEYRIGRKSRLKQDMVFYADRRRIEFRTEVDWQEKHTLLKVGFAMDICADTWRNEIQYGHTMRNMHANTSWDQAQFEVCAHKWVDVSEAGFGVALLNDCKYGHDSMDDMISLTLLRSPWGPDPEADEGGHAFVYALLPHPGDFSAAAVVQDAYELNVPVRIQKVGKLDVETTERFVRNDGFCAISASNVIIEAIKRSEADDGIILRLYEAEKKRTHLQARFVYPLKKVTECNLMEEETKALAFEDDTLTFSMRPFEIKTLKVLFKI